MKTKYTKKKCHLLFPVLYHSSNLTLASCLALNFRAGSLKDILVNNSFVQGDIHRVPCGHEVIVVINFHKGLDFWSLGDFLLAHGSCHFWGIAVNFRHGTWLYGAIVKVLHDDSFASRGTSIRTSTTFPGFMNLPSSTAGSRHPAERKEGHFRS